MPSLWPSDNVQDNLSRMASRLSSSALAAFSSCSRFSRLLRLFLLFYVSHCFYLSWSIEVPSTLGKLQQILPGHIRLPRLSPFGCQFKGTDHCNRIISIYLSRSRACTSHSSHAFYVKLCYIRSLAASFCCFMQLVKQELL